MTYVVTESCINCKHTDCVDVCPVDCFVEGANFLLNAQAAKAWPPIIEKKHAPVDADHWAQIKDKRTLLELA